jgi:hypothetical protein
MDRKWSLILVNYRGLAQEKIDTLILLLQAPISMWLPHGGASGLAVLFLPLAGVVFNRSHNNRWFAYLPDYTGFILILGVGLFVLFRRDTLTILEIIASSILVLFALIMGGLLLIGLRSEKTLTNILSWVARHINLYLTFAKRDVIRRNTSGISHDVSSGLQVLRQSPST